MATIVPAQSDRIGVLPHRPVREIGRQDLTAHVNWTAVDDAATGSGLDALGRVNHDRFLLALGLGDDLAAPAEGHESESALRQRLALRALVLPDAMGRRFQVSVYGRGIPPRLRGLGEPPLPPAGDDAAPVGEPPRRIRLVHPKPS